MPSSASLGLIAPPEERGWRLPRFSWALVTGPLASIAILMGAMWQLRAIDIHRVRTLLPESPLFWMVFAMAYLAAPVSEWIIYRRLWRLPAGGMAALLRKLVSNELLMGYLGEVYFYAWARRHAQVVAAPFGVIKDVAILSAVAGNVTALLMVACTWRLFPAADLGVGRATFLASVAIVLFVPIGALVFRRRLFVLSGAELRFVMGVHVVRIAAVLGLAALSWHLLLPQIALTMWILLATVRQLVSRLPLIPGKDVVFAGLAALLVGAGSDVAAAVTLAATLTLAAHVMVGLALAVRGLIGRAAA